MVSQHYASDVNKVYVILGNAAILKCEIPSFVADFVYVTGWMEENSGDSFYPEDLYGTMRLTFQNESNALKFRCLSS